MFTFKVPRLWCKYEIAANDKVNEKIVTPMEHQDNRSNTFNTLVKE